MSRYGKAGIRKDSWTHEQDILLARTMIREQDGGMGIMEAAAMAAPIVGRSQASCYNRWNNDLKGLHWESVLQEPESKIEVPKEAPQPMNDPVTNPTHYTAGGIETIDFIRAKLSKEEFAGYCRGNVLKYISRAPHKNGVEDYQKAQTYLGWLIKEGEA